MGWHGMHAETVLDDLACMHALTCMRTLTCLHALTWTWDPSWHKNFHHRHALVLQYAHATCRTPSCMLLQDEALVSEALRRSVAQKLGCDERLQLLRPRHIRVVRKSFDSRYESSVRADVMRL